jgi:TP901 family phage tail tape measure protein
LKAYREAMANKRLNAVITIGGAISGSLRSAFGTATGELQKIGRAVGELKNRQKELNNVVAQQERLGTAGSALKASLANQELGAINKQIDAYRRKQDMLRREIELHNRIGAARAKYRGEMFDRVGSAVAVGAIMRSPLKAFEELDAAVNDLTVAMTNSTGQVPKQFEEIKKQTVELGNILPGTTADFVNVARALKEQGMGIESIVGGALKSSAHLAVVMKMVPEQAAEMTAKLREAFQLSDNEFATMADYTQRAKFGFGLRPDDLLLGAKYYGGKLNSLGITGAENVRKIYAIQGMAAQQGMDGSTFGTNFSMMLTRVGLLTERMNKNSKEMRAVNAELAKAGIKLEFFDKKGKFAGVENMVAQLDKLRAFSQEKRLQILTRLFGEEGGRPADLIARNGIEGFQKALAAMDNEASLERRIDIATKSFKNTVEALTGTITNALAAIGGPIAEMFMPVITRLNEIVGGPMMTWIEQNKTIVQTVGALVAGAAGLLAVGGAISGIAFVTTFAAGGFATLLGIGARLWPILTAIGSVALPLVVAGIRAIGAAMVANPIGAVITGLALAATLVVQYWEPIRAWFKSLWADIVSVTKTAIEWIEAKIKWVGETWKSTKEFFGFGDKSVMPGVGSSVGATTVGSTQVPVNPAQGSPVRDGAALPGAPTPPAVPSFATARGNVSNTVNQQNTINVTQQPGQDSAALASQIDKMLREKWGTARRGVLFDPAYSGAY